MSRRSADRRPDKTAESEGIGRRRSHTIDDTSFADLRALEKHFHCFDARDPRRRANEEHRRAHTRYRPVHRASVPLLHLLAPQSAPRARPAREASSSATRNDRDCRNAQLCAHRCARAAYRARRATRARQRYAARGIHLFDVHPRHSYHLTRLFWAGRVQSSVRALANASIDAVSSTTPSARATGTHRMPVARARWASSARLPSRFRLADPIRAPPLPFSLRRSRSRRVAPGTPHFFAPNPGRDFFIIMPSRKFVEIHDVVLDELRDFARARWGAHSRVGNLRDALRRLQIKVVVASLPKHLWEDTGEWYVYQRARDACGSKRGTTNEDLTALHHPPLLLLATGRRRKCTTTLFRTGRCRCFSAPKRGSLRSRSASCP